MREGKGTFRSNGYKYVGNWHRGLKHGNGQECWAEDCNSDVLEYDGEFKEDLKDGFGVTKYKDGSLYEGNWKEDQICGYGSLTMADKKYDGYWKDGGMDGHGELVWANGMRYFGQFKDGKVSGKGRLTSSDGSYFDGKWSDGKK